MQFVPMGQLLRRAAEEGYAVPSFCVWNAETVATVLQVAAEMSAPVILMSGPAERALLGPQEMGAVARCLAARFDVPAALHLDHGDTLAAVEECLAAGYTSVMLDYSSRPFPENAQAMRRVAEIARPYGATVEGEIGMVGRADDTVVEGSKTSTLTDPAEAAAFVAETGVDALAVSIGNAHGEYTSLPRLDFARLAALHAAVEVPLVLHGGSGTPEEDLRRAISLGITKVNIATELAVAVRDSLLAQWGSGEKRWLPATLATAQGAMARVVERWITLTGAAGRAKGQG